YGIPSNLPWAMAYPNGTVPTFERVHPTPIYEMILIAAIFLVLRLLKKRKMKDGVLFSIFLILAGIERFLIEFIRLNPKIVAGLTEAQIVSVVLILIGVVQLLSFRLLHRQLIIDREYAGKRANRA